MIRPTCAVIAAVALGSCGTEPDRHAVEIREVVGFWHVSLTPDASCTRFNPAPALDLNVTVLSHTGADIVTLQGGWELAGPLRARSTCAPEHFTPISRAPQLRREPGWRAAWGLEPG